MHNSCFGKTCHVWYTCGVDRMEIKTLIQLRQRWLLGLIALAGVAVFQHAQLGVIGLAALIVAVAHVVRALHDRSAGLLHNLLF